VIFDLINPSDNYVLETDDPEAAAIACILLGDGQYGLTHVEQRPGDVDCSVPIFMFGGMDDWFRDKFHRSAKDSAHLYIDGDRRPTLIAALDSLMCGTVADLKSYKDALEAITVDSKRDEFKFKWLDHRRGSMNNVGKVAMNWVKKLRFMESGVGRGKA
jgi:hypothetical protein